MPDLDHDETDGRRLLASLRGLEPDTDSAVDVSRAVRSGRRQVRLRHSVLPAAGGLAVVVLIATLALVIQQARTPQQPAAGTGSFSIAQQAFGVGSAGGLTPLTYETGRYRQRIELGPADGSQLSGITAVVTMYARGVLPYRNGAVSSPTGEAADPVAGRLTYWLTPDNANPVELAWQYAPDAWGVVTVTGNGASRDRAYKVALSVTTGGHETFTAPVVVPASALGDGYRVVGIRGSIGPKVRSSRFIEVLYGRDDAPQPPGGGTGWIAAGLTKPAPSGTGTGQVAGRPTTETSTSVSFTDGSGIFVAASDSDYLTSFGGLPALRRAAAAASPAAGFHWPAIPSPSPTDSAPTTNPTATPSPTAT